MSVKQTSPFNLKRSKAKGKFPATFLMKEETDKDSKAVLTKEKRQVERECPKKGQPIPENKK